MQILKREQSKIIIPENISNTINERGFYLYSFITPKEVKTSIERDYLKILSFIAFPLGIVSIILGIIVFPLFLATIGIAFIFIIFYLLILAIKRSITLINISNLVLTDKAISIGGRIIKNEDLEKENLFIRKYEEEFNEKIFGESRLSEMKGGLFKQVIEKITNIFGTIFRFTRNLSSRDSAQFMLIGLLLGVVYIGVISGIYFIGIFIIWIFGLVIMLINKAILKITGQKVYKINNLFNEIDKNSNNLTNSKNNLSISLNNAKENKWQDGLLNNINKGIEQVNYEANISIKNIIKLRKALETSKYNDIFNFNIYNNWIKKQILEPLKNILELLDKNNIIITKTIDELEKQISETKEVSFKNTIEMQKVRLEKQKEEFEKYKNLIITYIEKIKI